MTSRELRVSTASSYRDSHKAKGADYDRMFQERSYVALLWELERKALDDLVPSSNGAQLDYLDFACGTGRVLAYLEERMATAAGVDVSSSMLAEARRRTRRARLVEADVTTEQCVQAAEILTAICES